MMMRIVFFIQFLSLAPLSLSQLSSPYNIPIQPSSLVVSPSLQSCCQYLNNELATSSPSPSSLQLIQCINMTMTSSLELSNLSTIVPYYENKAGPKLFITLLTRITPEIYDYGAYSYFLQSVYANHNGYILLPLYQDSTMEDYLLYRKLAPLQEALMGVSADCDYIVWVDADIAILDLGMRIEKIAAEYPKAHLLASADVSAVMNSGFIIFKNSPWTIKFIKQWWVARSLSRGTVTDQMGFEYVYDKLSTEDKSRIVFLAPDALNSDAPPMSRQLPHNQVLHLAAESSKLRQQVFQHGMIEVCDALEKRRQPAPQIGLHRELVRKMTEVSYGIQAHQLISKYQNWNYQQNIEKDREVLLNEMTTLRYDTSKHLYAISARTNEIESPESVQMRRETSQIIANITSELLTSILNVSPQNTPAITMKDIPLMMKHQDLGLLLNLLKISSESTYEFLQTLQIEIFSEDSPLLSEWKYLANQLTYNLDLLSHLVNKQQQHLILDMKASLLGNLGDLYLAINREEESIALFRESLSIYKQLKVLKDEVGLGGGGGDKRALLSIQSSLARALCSGTDTDEGMKLFRVTIAEESAHVGAYHHNLLTKYYNAGICAASKGLIVEAIENMNDCIKTCELNPHIPKDSTCKNAQTHLEDLHRRRRFAPTDL